MLALCFFASSCRRAEPSVRPAFYHWRTALHLTGQERLHLDSLGAKRLYVKFFDVDWDAGTGGPVPLAQVQIDTAKLSGLEIVPTVFITNRTFLNLAPEAVPALADRIFDKMTELSAPLLLAGHDLPVSFQFDCDWSGQTGEKFFALIEHFRKKMPPDGELSATIRLHQVKYFDKTGVPPVDRGVLMCYNTGDLEDWETQNSILDPATVRLYMPARAYPLPLDFALPLFRWGVLFRDGRMIKLLNDLGSEDLADTLRYAPLGPNRFEVKKSTFLQGHYLYTGDRIRLESARQPDLEAAALLLRSGMFRKPAHADTLIAVFYHLDTSTMRDFSVEQIEKVLDVLRD